MRAASPLPVRLDWMPSYLAPRGDGNRDYAFRFLDPEGVKSQGPNRYHGAVDWFAPGGTPVRAPGAGTVVRADHSDDHDGQEFGGVLVVQQPDSLCWTMRHVDPAVRVGTRVGAGDVVARVTVWNDGHDHLHLEIWRSLGGGYLIENMIDPRSVQWDEEVDVNPFYFEEMPHLRGGDGPVVVWHGRSAGGARRAERENRGLGRAVTTVRDEAGVFHVLWWARAPGHRFRFGGWAEAAARDLRRAARESSTGRRMRAFTGKGLSLYPWAAEA
jgi:murein DD-endopeptidase MepM/ murein hydrolase activator NlpD